MRNEPPDLGTVIQGFLEEVPVSPTFASALNALAKLGSVPSATEDSGIEPTTDDLRAATAFIVHYVGAAVDDHHLSPEEQQRIRELKRYFRLEEGDILRLQREAVENLLLAEMGLILRDQNVDDAEELHQVDLQKALDLGYDQFLDLVEPGIRPLAENILEEGEYGESAFRRLRLLGTVIPLELDPETELPRWASPGSPIQSVGGDEESRTIGRAVRDAVWRRDQGKCADCGGQDRLEFDHIIPFAKGGSNTYRNIRLLCQDCNRKKSDKIG